MFRLIMLRRLGRRSTIGPGALGRNLESLVPLSPVMPWFYLIIEYRTFKYSFRKGTFCLCIHRTVLTPLPIL